MKSKNLHMVLKMCR